MLSQNKGITLITLVITIIVLAILTTVSINVGYGTYKEMVVTGYVSRMNMIQSRVNVISQQIQQGDTSYENIGTPISSLSSELKSEAYIILNGETISEFKYYNTQDLAKLGIEKIEQDVFINLNTRIIYSVDSVEYEGQTYYNQYQLPNGVQVIEYSELQTQEPEFTLEKNNYGLTTQVNITNIIYDEQISGSDIYYGEVTDSSTTPVTVDFWRQVNGTSFSVTKTATYAVKLVDKNGGETIKTVDVVTCNSPELTAGMVPVVYENGKWKKVQDNEIGKWYDYAEGKWANIMLSDGLEVAEDGSITTMGSMFVWIPRYAYQITSNYHNGGEGISGNINVKFLKNLTYLTTDETTTKMINASGEGNWNVHPAFTDGTENNYANGGWDRELAGFWVAKFEASSTSPNLDYGGGNATNLDVKVLPNVTSWRGTTITNMFANCLNMNKTDNIYGIPTNAVTHLMKNSEWGAVAYLTQSKYGRNGTEVTINNSSSYITGNAGNYVNNAGNSGGTTNEYNTENGVLASTTGTIYGIYDMSGGAFEYVAGAISSYIDSGTYALSSITGFSEKMVDRYEKAGTEGSGEGNYNLILNRYGDAIYEISATAYNGETSTSEKGWNRDYSLFPYSTYPYIIRGGYYSYTSYAGIFCFNRDIGSTGEWKEYGNSFRPTIIVE